MTIYIDYVQLVYLLLHYFKVDVIKMVPKYIKKNSNFLNKLFIYLHDGIQDCFQIF